MNHLMLWNPEDWTTRERYEALIDRVGGLVLTEATATARAARQALEGSLTLDQRELWLDCSDGGVDAGAIREVAATRVALAHGIAIGAALAAFPESDPATLTRLACALTGDLLAADAPEGEPVAVGRAVLDALGRAERVAARPRWTGGHAPRGTLRRRPAPGSTPPAASEE